MDSDTVWQHIDTESSWLTDLLEALPEAALAPRGVRLVVTDTDWAYGSAPGAAGADAHPPFTMTGRVTGSTGSAPPPAAAIPEEGR